MTVHIPQYPPKIQYRNLSFSGPSGLPVKLLSIIKSNGSQNYLTQLIYFNKMPSKFNSPGLKQSLYLIYNTGSLTAYQGYSKTWQLTRKIVHVLSQCSKTMFLNHNEWEILEQKTIEMV